MKKLFFVAGIALSLSVAAQTEKGSWMVGANFADLNLGFGKNSTSNFSISANPNVAYFISDNLGVGGEVNVAFLKTKGVKDAISTIGVQPLIRYYFTNDNKMGIFGQGSIGILSSSIFGNSETGLTFSVGAGLNYFINKNIAFEAGLKYINVDEKVAGVITNGFLQNNIGLNFGLQIFLPKKSVSHMKSTYRKK